MYSFVLTGGTANQTQIARVRDEIDDTTLAGSPVEGRDYFMSDERILRRLTDMAGEASSDINVAMLVAASALDTLSTNQAYVLKKKTTMGEDVDGPAVASAIRAHATTLRARVLLSEEKAHANVDDVYTTRRPPSTTSVPTIVEP